MLLILGSLLMSFALFAGGEITVKYSATGSGMSISVSGVNGGTKQINVYKTTSGNNQSGKFLTQLKVSNGSGKFSVDGVKCKEQIYIRVSSGRES